MRFPASPPPVRIASPVRLRILGGVGLAAAGAWLGLQFLYVLSRAATHPHQKFAPSAGDYALLAVVPYLAGLWVFLRTARRNDPPLLRRLGMSARALWPGIWRGVLGALLVVPVMALAGTGLDVLYKAFNFQHPDAHELLLAMRSSDNPLWRWMLVFGACALAPLFEEMLFRGCIQTFLSRLFSAGRRSLPAAWSAIAVTSVCFASLHEPWTAPLILLLSVMLGIAYERTQNLWVPIVIHALFNAVNTAAALQGSG